MKFSHSLQFNAVPDWAPYYLSYSSLKKVIYHIERDLFAPNATASSSDLANNEERQTLLDFKARANALFLPALDKELEKIVAFYYKKERELLSEFESLQSDVAFIENYEATFAYNSPIHYEEASGTRSPLRSPRTPKRSNTFDPARAAGLSLLWKSGRPHRTLTGSASSPLLHDDSNNTFASDSISNGQGVKATSETDLPPPSPSGSVPTSPSHSIWAGNAQESLQERRIGFKIRAIDVFVLLSELKSFVSLNYTGFTKILKKYDKITGNDLKKSYLNTVVSEAYPFKAENRARLDETIQRVEVIYSRIACFGNYEHGIRELKSHLREHIVWERNTVWRDMIGIERKSTAVGIRTKEVPVVGAGMESKSSLFTFSAAFNRSAVILALCIIVFLVLLNVETFESVEEGNCLAILVLASLMWATEVIPLFVTSLVIPFLVIILRVLRDDADHSRLTPKLATKKIFAAMFSPVIMLLLGGFAIAAALSKYHIAKAMATWVLSRAGTKPSRVLFANMLVATLLSMWISNVAAPVLCFSLIQPILRTLPGGSTYARSLIMGIALASNIGGMASPISSPQNIIAIDNMDPSPSWAEWFFITLPIALMSDVLVWLLLVWIYNPTSGTAAVHAIRQAEEPVTWTQIFVCSVTVATVLLWCFESQLDGYLGDMGVVAIFPLIAFFGMGILTKDEFNSFPWTVIVLAMGGISLGKAVESSGLLFTIAHHIQQFVVGFTTFQVLAVFVCLMMVVATFLSHTVSALIILPIVAEVGGNMADPRPRLLVMGSALMCSGAMGLPMSGFPNMNAIMLEDEMGAPYLTTTDFLKAGVPGTALVGGLVITVGYLLMDLLSW